MISCPDKVVRVNYMNDKKKYDEYTFSVVPYNFRLIRFNGFVNY